MTSMSIYPRLSSVAEINWACHDQKEKQYKEHQTRFLPWKRVHATHTYLVCIKRAAPAPSRQHGGGRGRTDPVQVLGQRVHGPRHRLGGSAGGSGRGGR